MARGVDTAFDDRRKVMRPTGWAAQVAPAMRGPQRKSLTGLPIKPGPTNRPAEKA